MAALRAYAELRRALTVNRVVLDLAVDIVLGKLYQPHGLGKRPLSKRIVADLLRRIFGRERIAPSFPIQFRRTLERLGPTYVKLGQILSLRDDMLPERLTRELRKLQSKAPEETYDSIKQVVEADFNKPISTIFEYIDEKPIAAASLAQVHKARLKDGRKVVVKVQRPGIRRIISEDISIMQRLAKILAKLPFSKDYRPVELVDEFTYYTMRELDFVQEAKHAETFRENFKDDPYILFPEIYWQYTSKRVLTMEFVDGITPDDHEKLQAMGIDTKKVAHMGANALLKMLYIDGFFHGDPHPGNMLIVGRSKICFLDLGMIGSFSEETRRNMYLYFYYMVNREFEFATRYLANITSSGPKANLAGFRRELSESIKRWSGSNFQDYSLGRLIFETMNIGAKNQLYFHRDLVLSSKAILTIEAVGNILDPDLDISKVSKPLMEKIFLEQFSPSRISAAMVRSLPDYMRFVEDLPQNLLNTFSMVSSGKFQIEVAEQAVERKQKTKLQEDKHSLFSAATLLAGTVFAVSEQTPGPIIVSFLGLTGLPWLSIVMFALSGYFFFKGQKKPALDD